MPTDQVLLVVLGLAVLTNLVLVGVIQLRAFQGRRSADQARAAPDGPLMATSPVDDEDARAAAAIEAFVGGSSAAPLISAPAQVRSHAAPAAVRRHTRESTGLPLADQETWERTLRAESERVARFGGSLTIVMAELARIEGLADRLGTTAADKVVAEVTRLLASETRGADLIASLGGARFAVLLVETDERNAVPYIERVRAAADGWLEDAGLTISLSLGWASPPEGGQAIAAVSIAQQRMHDAARGSPNGPRRGAPPA